jgi:PPP family 3-phenylpropionic acid transporter
MSALRLSLFYAAYYVGTGVFLPFWPVWLASRELSGAEIGVVLAVSSAVRIVAPWLVAQIADRRGSRRPVMIGLAAIALTVFILYWPSYGFLPIVTVSLLFSAAWVSISPLGESLTLMTAAAEGFDYGRVRLWGSLSFILASLGAGALVGGRDPDSLLLLGGASVAAVLLTCLALPDRRAPPHRAPSPPVAEVLRLPGFLLLLGAAGCVQASHAFYYGFSALHWRAAGLNDGLIGLLWAEGVVAEVILFWAAPSLLRRVSPALLIAAGGLAGVVRWTAFAESDSLVLLVALQALHAFTFGSAHLGAVHFIARAVPPALSATAQSLYAAAVAGVLTGLASAGSGWLYERWDSQGYLAMTLLAAVGGLGALRLARMRPL